MRNKILYNIVLISAMACMLLFIACDSPTIRKDLIGAEIMIEARPDSASIILKQIRHPEKLSGRNRALYALLLTKAMYRDNTPILSDSLISIAAGYYRDKQDPLRKGWSYYYYGKYYQDNNDKKRALECYQQASAAASETTDNKLNELIYKNWGTLLLKEKPYDDGTNKLKKALEYARLRKDTLSEGFLLRNLGLSYMWKGEWDEALTIHEICIELARKIGNEELLASLYNNISIIYWRKKNYSLGLEYVNKSLSFKNDSLSRIPSYSMKGTLFYNLQQYDSTRYYIEKHGLGTTYYSKANYYDALSLLEERLGNYKKALKNRNMFSAYMDSIRISEKDSELIALQRKYDYSVIQNENNRLKLDKQKDEIIILVISFITVILTLIYAGYNYKKKKEKENLIQIKDDLVKQSVIELQKKTARLQKQKEELLSQRKELNLHQQKEEDLKARILKMDTIIQKIESLDSYNEIKKRSMAELALSDKEFSDLEDTVNLCYNDFATRLRKDFPKLKEDDIHLCCLIKIKVSNKNIASLLNTNDMALKKRRYRIKHDRMELSDETENLEQFLSNY